MEAGTTGPHQSALCGGLRAVPRDLRIGGDLELEARRVPTNHLRDDAARP